MGQNRRFFSRVTLKFEEWPWKTIGHSSIKLCSSFHRHVWIQTGSSCGPETAKLGFGLYHLDLWPLTLTFCMDTTSVIDNNSRKFQDDTMIGTWWKRCDRRTDSQTGQRADWTIQTAACLVAAKNTEFMPRNLFKGVCKMTPDSSDLNVLLCCRDVIMSAMPSELSGVLIVRSTVCSAIDQRKHKSSASMAFVRGIQRRPLDSPHKGPVTWKMFPLRFVGVIKWFSKTDHESTRAVDTETKKLCQITVHVDCNDMLELSRHLFRWWLVVWDNRANHKPMLTHSNVNI